MGGVDGDTSHEAERRDGLSEATSSVVGQGGGASIGNGGGSVTGIRGGRSTVSIGGSGGGSGGGVSSSKLASSFRLTSSGVS